MSQSEGTIAVQVVRSLNTKRVLYLDCSWQFADFLASVSSLPTGALFQILDDARLGPLNRPTTCLYTMHKSLSKLDFDVYDKRSKGRYANPSVSDKVHMFFNTYEYEFIFKTSFRFLVKADLSIVESSSDAVLELLRSANVGSITELESKIVNVTRKTALRLVLAALNLASEPLTEVFTPLLERKFSNIKPWQRGASNSMTSQSHDPNPMLATARNGTG